MRRQIRGLDQGAENIQDGVSVCKIIDGSLTEIHDILHRMTELSVKSANGTWAPQERFAIDLETRELKAELNRLTANTSFNEMQLCSPTDLQIGPSFQPGSGQAPRRRNPASATWSGKPRNYEPSDLKNP